MELKIDPIIMNDKLWKEDPKKPNEKPLLTEEEYKSFLQAIDDMQIKEQSIGIRILNQLDEPLAEIEGYATAGSISLNGLSAIRRSGSLTMMAQTFAPEGSSPAHIGHLYPLSDQKYSINEVTNIENLISINKRVKIEVKLANSSRFAVLKKEKEEDEKPTIRIQPAAFIFELGIFVVKNATVSHSTGGLQISMTLGDKMCLLNGECGGELQSAITHSPVYTINSKNEEIEEPVTYKTLITELVCEQGGIDPEKIQLDEIFDNPIKNQVRWTGNSPIYLYRDKNNNKQYHLTYKQQRGTITYKYNEVLGVKWAPFVYPGELTSAPGESIVSVLDKIKNSLGNYEYFFDVEGVFHFQQIKNFVNEGSPINDLAQAIDTEYLTDFSADKVAYDFNKENSPCLITSYNNAPQYTKVKNDITVWGQEEGSKLGIRYHLVIDERPVEKDFKIYQRVQWYIDSLGIIRAKGTKYGTEEVVVKDWRQQLYYDAIDKDSSERSIFDKEIIEEIPKIMNILEGEYYNESNPSKVKYFLDYLDPRSLNNNEPVRQLAVHRTEEDIDKGIGRRTESITDNNINCVFSPDFKDILFVNNENEWIAREDKDKYTGFLISADFNEYLGLGTAHNSAYDLLRSAIHEYTSYQNSISISALPIYYLEPNIRVAVNDPESDIHGHYMIQTISIPLAVSGIMNITATQALERV